MGELGHGASCPAGHCSHVLLDIQTKALLQGTELLQPTLLDFCAVKRKVEKDRDAPGELGYDPSVRTHEFRRMSRPAKGATIDEIMVSLESLGS